MESICGSPFWNHTLAWQSESPDLTQCFQETVLIWLPCAFLWILSPIEYYKFRHLNFKSHLHRNGKRNHVPWSLIPVLKVAFSVLLITLTMCQLTSVVIRMVDSNGGGNKVYPIQWITPLVQLVTFSLATVWILVHRSNEIQSSGVLFIFWFLLSISSSFTYYSLLKHLLQTVSITVTMKHALLLPFFLSPPSEFFLTAFDRSELHLTINIDSSYNFRVAPLLLQRCYTL